MHIRVAGPYDRTNVVLGDRPLVFGRDPRCDVVLEDPAVAPRHAVVQRTARGVEVVDLGPPGGLRIDGVPVPGGIVGPGRVVLVGATSLSFDVRDELAAGQPPAMHPAPPPRAQSAPSYPAYVPPAPARPKPKKGGAGLAIGLTLAALAALAAAGGFFVWRGYFAHPEASNAPSVVAPAPPLRGAASGSGAAPSAPRASAARPSAAASARAPAPNATAGIEPLVFDRNPFAEE